MKKTRTQYEHLRKDLRDACDGYFQAVTQGWSNADSYTKNLAAIAFKVHLFEQGRRSAKR